MGTLCGYLAIFAPLLLLANLAIALKCEIDWFVATLNVCWHFIDKNVAAVHKQFVSVRTVTTTVPVALDTQHQHTKICDLIFEKVPFYTFYKIVNKLT